MILCLWSSLSTVIIPKLPVPSMHSISRRTGHPYSTLLGKSLVVEIRTWDLLELPAGARPGGRPEWVRDRRATALVFGEQTWDLSWTHPCGSPQSNSSHLLRIVTPHVFFQWQTSSWAVLICGMSPNTLDRQPFHFSRCQKKKMTKRTCWISTCCVLSEIRSSPGISMTSFHVIFSFSIENSLLNSIDLVIDVCDVFWSTFEEFAEVIFDKSTGNDQRITDLELFGIEI